jgi:hypothetical protein
VGVNARSAYLEYATSILKRLALHITGCRERAELAVSLMTNKGLFPVMLVMT